MALMEHKFTEPIEGRPIEKKHPILFEQNKKALEANNIGELAEMLELIKLSGMVVMTVDSQVLACNSTLLQILGLDPNQGIPERITNVNALDFLPAEQKGGANKMFKDLVDGTVPEVNQSFTSTDTKGNLVPNRIHAFLYPPNPKDPKKSRFVIAEIQDTSLQERLQEEESKFEQVFNCIPIGVFVYGFRINSGTGELEGVTYTLWNKQMEMLSGMTKEEVVGGRIEGFNTFHHTKEERVQDAIKQAIRGETVIITNLEPKVSGKKIEIYVDATYAPFKNKKGEIIGAIVAMNNVTERYRLQKQLEEANDQKDKALKESEIAWDQTLEGWSGALELRDRETKGHSVRVVDLTLKLAKKMGIVDKTALRDIRWGTLLHDIGKMGIPDAIIYKPAKLTDEERAIVQMHPELALGLLGHIDYLVSAKNIPYQHHEKWDGSGYPRGLKGEEISLAARIFAIVDVWDALISERPYKPAYQKEKALSMIITESGKHFDPAVVIKFAQLILEEIRNDEINPKIKEKLIAEIDKLEKDIKG
jgi:PAS domain S-box-containing protein